MKRVLVIFSLVVVFFVLQTFYRAGQFRSIERQFDGQVIRIYDNAPGPEDIQVDRTTSKLFISAAERRSDDDSDNGIYVLDLSTDDEPYKLEIDFIEEFNPHGISLLRLDSTLYLYAINHNSKGDFIEQFIVDNNGLSHMNTISGEGLCCPNDLVVLDIDRIYISNDHGQKEGFGRTMEEYLRIPKSSIFYYDGNETRKVAKPFHYANGINVSPDNKKLYLAETTGNAITTFEIQENGDLAMLGSFDAGTGVDNIDIDLEGNLWIGAHPKLLDYVSHSKDPANISPSQVLKFTPISDYEFEVELIYQDEGQELSGSSAALIYNNELFIGVVHNRSILRAKLKN